MKLIKTHSKLLVACIALMSLVTLLKASYYKPDFFPIGLTGIGWVGNPPYGNVPIPTPWKWTPKESDNNEQDLIEALGVNCIGCEDAHQTTVLSFTSNSDYVHKVCMELDSVYVIAANYYVQRRYQRRGWGKCSDPDSFSVIEESGVHMRASTFFRSYNQCENTGWGDPEFAAGGSAEEEKCWCDDCDTCNCLWGCNGAQYDNWHDYDGDTNWKKMADTAIYEFEQYFDTSSTPQLNCIWGWNLITEGPVVTRNIVLKHPWHGCFAAVDYIFTGHQGPTTRFTHLDAAPREGYRGAEGNTHRMIIAKAAIFSMHRSEFDIFEALPDIDAFVLYHEGWCGAHFNYGDQAMFDTLLYGSKWEDYTDAQWRKRRYTGGGLHNDAIYMQKYARGNLAYTDQKRRLIVGVGTKWLVDNSAQGNNDDDSTKAKKRRPCPPELRCVCYLAMSRGAKGLLFHPWNTPTTYNHDWDKETPGVTKHYPYVKIPCTSSTSHLYMVGLRDHQGYPFGHTSGGTYYLNAGVTQGYTETYWHKSGNRKDSTYLYLKTLIKEIKRITPKLMELDWVNAYSLMSTDPNWTNPCPHYYMEDVWGVDYMDVAFFDHPYEPVGVEYFMMVNREGIADMTNRDVGVALNASYWPEEDTLIITDMANRDNPRKLIRDGERYVFKEVFEPGEGKLYRVAPRNAAPVTLAPNKKGGVR